jgi:hypothetical protein
MSFLTKDQADSMYQPLGSYLTSTDLIKFKSGLDADMARYQLRGNFLTKEDLMNVLQDYQLKQNASQGNMLSQQVTQAVQSSVPNIPPLPTSPSTLSFTVTPQTPVSMPAPTPMSVPSNGPLPANLPLPPPVSNVPMSATTIPISPAAYLRYRNRQIRY